MFAACVALYRVLQAVHYLDAQPELIRTLLPRLVYMLALAAFAVLVRAPRSAFASSLHAMLYGVTANLLPTFLLLLGPQASPAVLLLLVQRDLFLHLHAGSKRASFPVTALLWGFFTLQYFFFTGHVCDVASVHFEAGYYGSEEFNLMLSPTLVVINTFASPLFFALSLPMLSLVQNQQTPAAKRYCCSSRVYENCSLVVSAALPNSLFQSLVVYLSFFSLNATVMNLVVFVHRRHLMVWRVFAPKFLFDQVFLLVAMALMLIAFATLEKRLGAMKPVQKTNGLHLH